MFLDSCEPYQNWHKPNQFRSKPDTTFQNVCDVPAQSHRKKSAYTPCTVDSGKKFVNDLIKTLKQET